MSSTEWQGKLQEAQDLTIKATQSEFGGDYETAFRNYVRAGETYLWLIRQDAVTTDKARLRKAAEKVLARAESIKQVKKNVKIAERSLLSEEEQARALDAGARLNSFPLPEWRQEHCQPGPSSHVIPLPALAPKQIEQKARYLTREELPRWSSLSLYAASRPLRGNEIVQRVVTDCSFVAALEVAAEHDAKWGTNVRLLAHSPLYPKNEQGYPTWSTSKKYTVRLHVNGSFRSICIDGSVPCYPDDSPMCAVGFLDDALQIWPSLIEKAYMSLRGGYDFAGSNSSIDLHVLTGWIPEQVGFQHSSFQRERTWERVKSAFDKGHLLMTAGTSRETKKMQMQNQHELIESHSYAILDLQEVDDTRWLVMMNPWETMSGSRVFRMSWNEACARLDSLYLNWSLSLFRHSLFWHGTWYSTGKQQSSSVQLNVSNTCEVWFLLTRHTTSTPKQQSATTDWIALHIFDASEDVPSEQHRGVYVNSSQTMLRCQLRPGVRRVTASRQNDGREATFTLSAYSADIIAWQDIPNTLTHSLNERSQWTAKTAGGNASQPTFFQNPQYRLTISKLCNIAISVETDKGTPVQAVMLWSRGKRVGQVVQGDIVASSGTYNYGLAMAEGKQVKAGRYTLVVSSFEKGTLGEFEIRVQSDQAVEMTSIGAEGGGMFQHQIRECWTRETACGGPKNAGYLHNPTFLLTVDRSSLFVIRLQAVAGAVMPHPSVNVAIFRSKNDEVVTSSGPYSDAICGVVVEETRLDAGEYYLVVSTYEAGVLADFKMNVYSDRRVNCTRRA